MYDSEKKVILIF